MNDRVNTTVRAVRRAAPGRPAVPWQDVALYRVREGLQ